MAKSDPTAAVTFHIGPTVPGDDESTAFGAPALKVKGKPMALNEPAC
jgi:hypothetical protein